MKNFCFILFLFGLSQTFAQEVDGSGNLKVNSLQYVKTKSSNNRLQGWYKSGSNSLQFNQAAFSNWIAGGVNSYSLNAAVDYEFNMTKGRHIWDNRIVTAFGILRNEDEDYRKSNDVIDFTSSYGYEFIRDFYFAASTNFKTQFTDGFDYGIQDSISGDYKKISSFMAPAYWSFGVGIDYKPNENIQLNFHPFTSRFTFVMDEDLQQQGNFGLKNDDDNFVHEFGAFLGARYKINLLKNITYDNRIGVYANYLRNFAKMDVAYQGVLDMKVNSLISAQATINLFYDEDQIKKTQLKETFGVGLAYKFNNNEKLKLEEENIPPPPSIRKAQKHLNEAVDKANKANKEVEEAKDKVRDAWIRVREAE